MVSLYRQGFRKIVVFNCHGGNWVLKPAMRELNFSYPGLMLIWTGPMSAEPPPEIHSGDGETSAMLHFHPDLVREGREDFSPKYTQEYCDYVGYEAITETGVWGKPSAASAERGAQRSQDAARRQTEYIRGTFARLEELRRRQQGE